MGLALRTLTWQVLPWRWVLPECHRTQGSGRNRLKGALSHDERRATNRYWLCVRSFMPSFPSQWTRQLVNTRSGTLVEELADVLILPVRCHPDPASFLHFCLRAERMADEGFDVTTGGDICMGKLKLCVFSKRQVCVARRLGVFGQCWRLSRYSAQRPSHTASATIC